MLNVNELPPISECIFDRFRKAHRLNGDIDAGATTVALTLTSVRARRSALIRRIVLRRETLQFRSSFLFGEGGGEQKYVVDVFRLYSCTSWQ